MTPAPALRESVWRAVAVLLLAALLLGALGRTAFSQSGATVTLAEYQARLEQVRSEIANAPSGQTQQTVSRAAGALAGIQSVELAGGQRLALQPLFRSDDSQQRALARIDAVLAQLRAAAGDRTSDRLEALDRVLAGDALHPERGVLGWLRRLLQGRDTPGTSPAQDFANLGARGLNILLMIAGGLVAVLLIGRIVQAALGAFMTDADVRAHEGDGEAPLTVASARRHHVDLAQVGSYREAVRLLYLATLMSLEDHGLLRLDRSMTNREVLASVGHRPEVQRGLRPVVDVFENVWYGEREPDREMFERYAGTVSAAAEAIDAAEPAAASNVVGAG